MTAAVLSALGLDKEDLTGRVLVIQENHGCDGSFILTSLMIQRLQKDGGVCLAALHNTLSHYQNIITKLSGLNLQVLQDKGAVEIFECLKEFSGALAGDCEQSFPINDRNCIAKYIYLMLKEKLCRLFEKKSSVCLVVDDLSDLLALGVPLKDVVSFLFYCRNLLNIFPGLSFVILSHVVEGDEEQNIIASGLIQIANCLVSLDALKTGHSNDVSGVLKVNHKIINTLDWDQQNSVHYKEEKWKEGNSFHYKLQDRVIKVFAPGTFACVS